MSYAPIADDLHAHLKTQIAIGYYDAEDLVEEAAGMFEIDEAVVRPLVDTLTTELERQIESWPEVTDCDRLDAAFSALDQSGIRARQHFACCNTCGHQVAWLALGELARAVALAEHHFPGCEAVAPLAVRLAQVGRIHEALTWICSAFRYVCNRDRITTLALPVLAVADAPRATATAMLDAWARADASLDALLPPSITAG